MSLAFFASRRGIVLVGVLIGVIAALLQNAGNPCEHGVEFDQVVPLEP
ncbi:hypothetical protein [Ferrimonas lipolytica]|uniref:Uncharacterized protein n=1 Tax=Ferrimonas lipolytica TaxID=2724191 RepID=A0A6H1UG52_9GAMM|nr:hypothetical protein [Ferrimonas lipolytica]QIZ77580.1 hypothetical protein HER31_12160 [Ferrimonas lipolytica]